VVSEPPPAPSTELELSARALIVGCSIGVLLALTNVYMGLKTGWWDSGGLTASLLGFLLLYRAPGSRGKRFTLLENNILQTAAGAVGAMPATVGLLGAIPALALLDHYYPTSALITWGIALGIIGIAIALLLRRKLLEEEALPFPSGTAAAELISAMHSSGRAAFHRGRTFLFSGMGAMAATWFRDGRPTWIPSSTYLPFSIAGVPAAALKLGLSWSPLLLGAGMLSGARAGLSLLLGAGISWGILAPVLLKKGIVAQSAYSPLAGWLAWPGVALVLGASAPSLLKGAGAMSRAIADLRSTAKLAAGGDAEPKQDMQIAGALALLAAVVTLIIVGNWAFGLHPIHVLLAIALSVVLTSVCARAAGQTDLAPFGKIGRITQLIFGALAPRSVTTNTMAGSIVAGDAVQTVILLHALKTGRQLGASPRRQVYAELLGVFVGAIVCIPIYALLVNTYGLGTPQLPVPAALEWKAVAQVIGRGGAAVPEGARLAVAIAFPIGILLALLSRTRFSQFLPIPAAVGIAFIAPAEYSLTMCLGSLLFELLRRARPRWTEDYAPTFAGGLIAGESLIGIFIAMLIGLGWMSV
jgi:putative OPT family oligopeptide transporter